MFSYKCKKYNFSCKHCKFNMVCKESVFLKEEKKIKIKKYKKLEQEAIEKYGIKQWKKWTQKYA